MRNVNRQAKDSVEVTIQGSEKKFETDIALAKQADEFQDINLPGLKIYTHGEGLISEIDKVSVRRA